jgi:hypothetical protein
MEIDILSALISPNRPSSSMEPIVFTRTRAAAQRHSAEIVGTN